MICTTCAWRRTCRCVSVLGLQNSILRCALWEGDGPYPPWRHLEIIAFLRRVQGEYAPETSCS